MEVNFFVELLHCSKCVVRNTHRPHFVLITLLRRCYLFSCFGCFCKYYWCLHFRFASLFRTKSNQCWRVSGQYFL